MTAAAAQSSANSTAWFKKKSIVLPRSYKVDAEGPRRAGFLSHKPDRSRLDPGPQERRRAGVVRLRADPRDHRPQQRTQALVVLREYRSDALGGDRLGGLDADVMDSHHRGCRVPEH